MRKLVLVNMVLMLLGVVSAPAAQAQVCVDFLDFCDGLELYVEGTSITGLWLNPLACDGEDFPVVGVIRDGLENPCGPDVGWLGVACDERFDCEIAGDEWYFVLDAKRDHWDLGNVGEGDIPPVPGACWLDNIRYEVLLGPCPWGTQDSGETLFSTIQGRR